ncbi:MAG: glyceraldehyde 3-phosphate dehydrogenase, partial [Dokdonia sp.]
AINDLTDTKTLAHLLQYDSAHGQLGLPIAHTEATITVAGYETKVSAERDPENLPWKELAIDMVVECTGIFRDREGLNKHLKAGAKKVVLSAPAKGNIKTVVVGVNDQILTAEDTIVSNASCTTNCLAPMIKVLDDNFGVVKGFMTTVHSYTGDQKIQDGPHSDLRRARAAAFSIIPTSTGAAKAVGEVMPHMKGKLDGMAMRVPTITGSATDLTVELSKDVSSQEVNDAMKKASLGMKGALRYTEDPIVSADIIGDAHACILDGLLTFANGNLVKVVGWYDNESGYSARLVELMDIIKSKG